MKDILCQCGDIIQPNDDALCGNCALEFHANKRKIESLEREIATLKEALEMAQADNRSLVKQMNKMAMKPNQEVITWHDYPDEKPKRNDWHLVITAKQKVTFDLYVDSANDFSLFGNFVKAWAYLPKGAKQ